jgi:hypothetical protein
VIYNDYVEERMKSSVENTLLKKASVYEQSLDFNVLLKLGKTEKEVAEKWEVDISYVSKIKNFAEFKNDFKEKDYVLTILTYEALEKLYWIKISKDIGKYNFVKEKIIKAYESGVRKIRQKHIFKWCNEYEEMIKGKEKEIQRKLYGEEIPIIQKPIESQQVQQVQLQVEKPISRIPTQEEVKEKEEEYKKKLREKKKKEKTEEERFEYNFKIISYSHPKRIVSIIKKILDGIKIEEKKKLNINEIFRKCEEALLNSITKKSDEEIEKLFRNVIEEILKGGKI